MGDKCCPRLSHISDLQTVTLEETVLETWCSRVSAGTDWLGVSIW